MAELRFEIRLHKAAAKEYDRLDHSVILLVDKALAELEVRADEIGKSFGKKRNVNLTGCKEIKLRDAGIRIVFFVAKQQVYVLQVVFVLAIDERDDDYVFRLAGKRYEDMKPSLKTE